MRLHLGDFLRLSFRIRQQLVLLPEVLQPRQRLVPSEDADGYLVKDGGDDKIGSRHTYLMCSDGDIAEKVLDWRDDVVLQDALCVYDYLVERLGVAHEDIILFGRSLGSSPSCFIAKERPRVGALILMSPFKSLREVAKDRVGQLLSYLLAERYRNIELIEQVVCPVLIIHGLNDSLIDISHSIA